MFDTKKLAACLLAASAVCAFVGGSIQPSMADAAVKHRTYSSTPSERNEASYLEKHTTFSQDSIAGMKAEGFSKEDIQNLYILKGMAAEKFDELKAEYRKGKKDINTVLKNLHIDKDEFEEQFERAFPEGEDTEFDRVQRIKNLRNMPF